MSWREGTDPASTPEDVLAGVRVLDLSRDLSAPYTSMMLAELGADVIEVEHPVTGDETRSWPPMSDGISGYFATVNRSKRGIAIDLKHPEGVRIVLDLARDADVVMQSFTPGVADRLGIGYENVRAVNEDVIYYSLSGFGQDGPWRTRRGYDPIMQAISGHMSVMGERGRGPVKSMAPIADVSTAIYGCAAILGALFRHERTGRGDHIDMSMLDVMVSTLSVVATRYLWTGMVPQREGTENPARVPSAAFECADGRYLQAVPNQRQWPAFCRALGHPEWADDPRFVTPMARVEHSAVLYPLVRDAMRTRTAGEWEEILLDATIACGPINDVSEVFDLPQVKHRGILQEYRMPDGRVLSGVAVPLRYAEAPSRIRRHQPALGEHSVEVLREIGRSPEEIDHLVAAGIVRASTPETVPAK